MSIFGIGNSTAGNHYGHSAGDVRAVADGLFGADLGEIERSLATNGSVGVDGSALNGYDLDPLVRYITLDQENHTPKIQRMHTFGVNALATEFNRLIRRGRATGNFRHEGQFGTFDNSVVERIKRSQRFMGRGGAVTHALIKACENSLGDAKAFEMLQQLIEFLLIFERDIWWADNSLNPLAFDGIFAQLSSDPEFNINKAIKGDAGGRETYTGGGVLNLSDLRTIQSKPLRYGGNFTACYCVPEVKDRLASDQDSKSRWYAQDQNSAFAHGVIVDQITNNYRNGAVDLVWDLFLYNGGKYNPYPENPADATKFHPDAPAVLAVAPTGTVGAGGKLPVDTYYYGIAAVNEVGEGPIKIQSTGYTTTNANGQVTITTTHGPDVGRVRSYRLYRSTTASPSFADMRYVKEIAVPPGAVPGGTFNTLVDDGTIIPGSSRSVQMDERSVAMGALEKPVAEDLPMLDKTERFHINAIGDVLVYTEKHFHAYSNIGGSVEDPVYA